MRPGWNWREATNCRHSSWPDPPPPLPPVTIHDDFEFSPPGSEPSGAAHVYHGGKGNAAFVRVVAEPGAGGSSHYLKFQDAPDLDRS